MARESDLWFGNVKHAQWVKNFQPGYTRSFEGFSEEIAFSNGGLWVERSKPWHNVYKLGFLTDVDDYEGVEAFARFYSGEYGDDYLRFTDPAYAATNLFNMSWAAPGLIEQGWKNFGGNVPTFSDTGANTYGKPPRKATWTIDTAANAVFGKAFTFLIPPTHTLWLGGSGAVTGTGALRVLPAGGAASTIALSADAAAPALTSSVLGSVASSATVFLTRTSTAASTVALTALWVRVLPTGETPTIARHFPGQGTTGLQFRGDFKQEPLVSTGGSVFLSITGELAEIEAWQ